MVVTHKYSLDSNFVDTFATSSVFNPFGIERSDTTDLVFTFNQTTGW